jgi:hypothetical protein
MEEPAKISWEQGTGGEFKREGHLQKAASMKEFIWW